MKKRILALAIPALLFSVPSFATTVIHTDDGTQVTIDGRIKAENTITKKGNDKGDHTEARLGLNADTQINDLLSGYGRIEWQGTNNKQDDEKSNSGNWDIETRYAFAGLSFGNYGRFDYGRNDGLLKAITLYTDVLPEFGADSTNYYLLANRESSVATYRNDNLFGLVDDLSFAIQYADSSKAENDLNNPIKPNQRTHQAFAGNVEYKILDTGISVGAAYAKSSTDEGAESVAGGIKYDANNIYLGGTYFHGRDKYKGEINGKKVMTEGFEAVAAYTFDLEKGAITPYVAYIEHKQKEVNDGERGYLAKYVDLALQYKFNQNISTAVDYKINLLKDRDIGTDHENAKTKDSVGLTLIYEF